MDAVQTRVDVDDIHPLREEAADPATFELLDLVLALYTLDRSTKIRSGQIRRTFFLRMPVLDPFRWRRVAPLLSDWFEAVTGDVVEISPVQRAKTIAQHHRRQRNFGFEDGEEAVGLLSEGLDSLCGVDDAMRNDRRIALASVITNPIRSSQISTVLAAMGNPRHFALRTCLHRSHNVRERSQRTRTVLALVTGMTVAHILGADRVECYENGFGLLNLPVPDLQYGGMSSQVLNPRHLPLWDRVSRAVFDKNILIKYPNRFLTKAEMVSSLSRDAQRLVAGTSSCDRLPRVKGGAHCGTCGSCRYRQLAIAAAGMVLPDVNYLYRHFGKGPDANLVLRYHAEIIEHALAVNDPWTALVRLHPELADVPFSDDGRNRRREPLEDRRDQLRQGTLNLLRRHVAEIRGWEAVCAA